MITLEELKERLIAECDEVTLLEFLQIDSATLLDRFEDIVQQKYQTLVDKVTEEEQDGEEDLEGE
jgi:ATP-dependent protease HslVU (ClpYQ) peptidase subunit